jgi:phosphoglycolate phosphatase
LTLPEALVLDLDGTLIDSATDLADSVNLLLSELDRPPISVDAVRGMIGDGLGMLTLRALKETGGLPEHADLRDLAERLLRHYIDPARAPKTQVFADVPETLQLFVEAGVRLGVCTNKSQRATEMVLTKTGLAGYFDCVVGQDKAKAPKPDRAHVEAVLAELGAPESALMVGDSGNDLDSGRNAGLKVILVTYGYGTPEALAAADMTVDRFGALPEAIAQLLG